MKITQEIINKAMELQACEEGIEWGFSVINQELTQENTIPHYFIWALNFTSLKHQTIDHNIFDFCVKINSHAALRYVPYLLTKNQLDVLIEKEPYYTLALASHCLTEKQKELATLNWKNKKKRKKPNETI